MTTYVSELGKAAAVSANKKYKAYKTPYGYEVYSITKELIFTENDIKYGKKLEAIHAFNISNLENLEWAVQEHEASLANEIEWELKLEGYKA